MVVTTATEEEEDFRIEDEEVSPIIEEHPERFHTEDIPALHVVEKDINHLNARQEQLRHRLRCRNINNRERFNSCCQKI